MNIRKYMIEHDHYITEQLKQEENIQSCSELQEKHKRTIQYMQHERLIHLMVTLTFAVFFLISMGIALMKPSLPVFILTGIFMIMLVFYIAHYFFMENTIQKWYKFADEIENRLKLMKEWQ